MCGIWFYLKKSQNEAFSKLQLYDAFSSIQHRGPDSSVFKSVHSFTDLFIGFHRLSIMDPSVNGDQPFYFEHNGRQIYTICNGEIYNHKELIQKYNLPVKSSSDCEVIPLLYVSKGFSFLEDKLRGEFSYIIIDIDHKSKQVQIHASSDPFGIRPMFYINDDNCIAFCSELKGLIGLSTSIKRFPPGSSMKSIVSKDNTSFRVTSAFNKYYCYDYTKRITGDLPIIQKQVRDTLIKSVHSMLISDRPLGCLLSGGLDSSLIASIASMELKKRGQVLKTFSIGMKGGTDQYYAELVAKHIDSDHTHIELTDNDFLNAIDDVVTATETFDITTIRASTGQYLISKWIRENTDIIVLLIGDGSDELTAGYMYFHNAPSPEELHNENKRLLEDIHLYDVLRADRGIAYNSLEARVPFLDRNFVDLYMSIDPILRTVTNGFEKWLLRSSFEDGKYLPNEVLWRRKEAFSDGVSSIEKPWYKIIQEKAELMFTDNDLKQASEQYTHCIPHTKEALYFRTMFDKKFGKHNDVLIPYYWLPKWSGNITEPSARVLQVYS